MLIAVVEPWLKRIRQGSFPGLSWLVGLLDEAVRTAGLRFAADLMLFRKSLHTLEGVIAEIGGGQITNRRHVVGRILPPFCVGMAAPLGLAPVIPPVRHPAFKP